MPRCPSSHSATSKTSSSTPARQKDINILKQKRAVSSMYKGSMPQDEQVKLEKALTNDPELITWWFKKRIRRKGFLSGLGIASRMSVVATYIKYLISRTELSRTPQAISARKSQAPSNPPDFPQETIPSSPKTESTVETSLRSTFEEKDYTFVDDLLAANPSAHSNADEFLVLNEIGEISVDRLFQPLLTPILLEIENQKLLDEMFPMNDPLKDFLEDLQENEIYAKSTVSDGIIIHNSRCPDGLQLLSSPFVYDPKATMLGLQTMGNTVAANSNAHNLLAAFA